MLPRIVYEQAVRDNFKAWSEVKLSKRNDISMEQCYLNILNILACAKQDGRYDIDTYEVYINSGVVL